MSDEKKDLPENTEPNNETDAMTSEESKEIDEVEAPDEIILEEEEIIELDDEELSPVSPRDFDVFQLDKAELEASIKREIEPLMLQMENVSLHNQTMAKRIGYGAVALIALTGILLFVAAGRIAGEVSALESATLAISKRIVNMNSALESFARLEQRITMLDQGQASILKEISGTSSNIDANQKSLSQALSSMGADLLAVNQDSSKFENLVSRFKQLDGQMASLESQIEKLGPTLGKIASVKSSIDVLLEIEKNNLKELFAKQIALEEAKASEAGKEISVEPHYPAGTIVFKSGQ